MSKELKELLARLSEMSKKASPDNWRVDHCEFEGVHPTSNDEQYRKGFYLKDLSGEYEHSGEGMFIYDFSHHYENKGLMRKFETEEEAKQAAKDSVEEVTSKYKKKFIGELTKGLESTPELLDVVIDCIKSDI